MSTMGTFQHHQEHVEMPRVTQVPEQVCPSSTELQADLSKQDISVGEQQMCYLAPKHLPGVTHSGFLT